jgi:hypothetical protein
MIATEEERKTFFLEEVLIVLQDIYKHMGAHISLEK